MECAVPGVDACYVGADGKVWAYGLADDQRAARAVLLRCKRRRRAARADARCLAGSHLPVLDLIAHRSHRWRHEFARKTCASSSAPPLELASRSALWSPPERSPKTAKFNSACREQRASCSVGGGWDPLGIHRGLGRRDTPFFTSWTRAWRAGCRSASGRPEA
jgi:hypothetical protein